MFGRLFFEDKIRVYNVFVKLEPDGCRVSDVALVEEAVDARVFLQQVAWPFLRGMPGTGLALLTGVFVSAVPAGWALLNTGGESGLAFFLALYALQIGALAAFSPDLRARALSRSGYRYAGLAYGTTEAEAYGRVLKSGALAKTLS
jgi:hypothetical protein